MRLRPPWPAPFGPADVVQTRSCAFVEPTCRFYPTIRFRVGAAMTASVPRGATMRNVHAPISRSPVTRSWHLRTLTHALDGEGVHSCGQADNIAALDDSRPFPFPRHRCAGTPLLA